MKEITVEGKHAIFIGLWDWFGRPWLALAAWNAFVLMAPDFNLPILTYWQVFMLNIAASVLASSKPQRWIIK